MHDEIRTYDTYDGCNSPCTPPVPPSVASTGCFSSYCSFDCLALVTSWSGPRDPLCCCCGVTGCVGDTGDCVGSCATSVLTTQEYTMSGA